MRKVNIGRVVEKFCTNVERVGRLLGRYKGGGQKSVGDTKGEVYWCKEEVAVPVLRISMYVTSTGGEMRIEWHHTELKGVDFVEMIPVVTEVVWKHDLVCVKTELG